MAQKITLITGCSTGIGLSMAVKLAKDAARKYLVYSTMRNIGKSKELEAAAGDALNDTICVRPLDVVSDDSVNNAVKDIIEKHGRIDVLINNAGIASFDPIEYCPMKSIQDVMDTNFFGTVRMLKAVLPHMKEQRSGHIINISSVGGLVGIPFYEFYGASKFAVEGLTESLSIRMKDFDIKITNLNPGAVDTNINENIVENNRSPNWQKMDSITKQQLKILYGHQKHHFTNETQTSEEIADIVQNIVELPDMTSRPMRVATKEYYANWAAKKFADIGAQNWTDFSRYLINEPHVDEQETNKKKDGSKL